MPAINVARTDTFETQRVKINQISDQIFNISQGGSDLSTGNLKLGNGTKNIPSLGFINDEKLGLYRYDAGVLGFVAAEKNIFNISVDGGFFYRDFNLVKKVLTTPQVLITDDGENYDSGTYIDVPLTGGSGQFATADITVTGVLGSITNIGSGYEPGTYQEVSLTGGSGNGITAVLTVEDIEIELVSPGSNYADGFYNNVPLTGGSGNGAEIGFSVSDGEIVGAVLQTNGSGYLNGETLSVDPAFDGVGSGGGFSVVVSSNPGSISEISIFSSGSGYTIGNVLGVDPSFDGVGGGSSFAFTIDDIGFISDITINNEGLGYNSGDVLSVSPTELTQPIRFTNYVSSVDILTFASTLPSSTFTLSDIIQIAAGSVQTVTVSASSDLIGEANNNYTGVAATGGTGSGATFDVSRTFDGSVSSVVPNSGGSFYTQNDTLTIAGNLVGGSSPADDITLTASAVSSSAQQSAVLDVVSSGGNISYIIIEPLGISDGDIVVKSSAPTTPYTTNTVVTKNKFFLDSGSGQELTPDLLFYVGNKYEFNYSDSSNSGHPFRLSIHPDGVHNAVTKSSVTLTASSNEITVADVAGILLGMEVGIDTGTGTLPFGTIVEQINGTTITLSENVSTSGTADLSFRGVEYTDGIVKDSTTLTITVSPLTPTLYYYCDVHPDMGGEDDAEATITIDQNNPKTFGSGFLLSVLGVLETNPIYTNILTGDLSASSFTGSSVTADSISTGSLTSSSSITANNVSISNELSSTNLTISADTIAIDSNLSVGSSIEVAKVSGNITTTGILKTTNTLNVNDKVRISNTGEYQSIGSTNIVLKPAIGTIAKVDSLSAFILPKGTTGDRPGIGVREDGAVRFNTTTGQYEGYNSSTTSWSSLGGVRDIDGNTYILAELTAGANDNTLWFYNDNNNTLKLTTNFLDFRSVKKISSAKLGLPTFTLWAANTPVSIGQYIKYRNNLYEVTGAGTLATTGSEPTHTSGVQNNGTAQLTWYSLSVGPIEFTEVEEIRVAPNKDAPLIVNSSLKLGGTTALNWNTISTIAEDLTLEPSSGKKVVIKSTTHLAIPAGNNNQKNTASAVPGSIRFNTEIQQFEGYSGTNWSSLGGVRDVDGNTYIIPETAPAANENILYFYNDNLNTLQLTKTSLDFTNIDTITTSGLNNLSLDTPLVTLNLNETTIDNRDVSRTFISSSKQYLDLGLSSGLNVDPILRLDDQGDVYLNTTFGTGSFNGVKVFDGDLKEFELADYAIRTSSFTLGKGAAETSAVNLYQTSSNKGCKVTIVSKSSSGKRSMTEYHVIDNGTDIFYNEFGSLNTSLDQYTASFDYNAGEVRITLTLSDDHANGDIISFTVLNQVIK